MKLRSAAAFAACLTVLATPGVADAADPLPLGAAKSANLEYVDRSADAAGITEGKFDRIGKTDILVVTGRFGFKTYDVSDPANPALLDTFMPPGINPANGYWQDEDMELDTKRNLIIGALDPRHNELDESVCPFNDGLAVRDPDCRSGFFVISYSDPANLTQVGDFVSLPAGHTASCIQDCRYIWTGGPARRSDQDNLGPIIPQGAGLPSVQNRLIGDGRPIWVTDLRNPARPVVSDEPIDLWRNDGYTDYSHDVDEDEQGIAWVAGRGGIRGYATSGWHRDPYQNRFRRASPFDPILVAGGGVAWDDPNVQGDDGTAQPVMLMHNSGRPTDGSVRASGVKKGNVLVGTEEDFTTTNGCGDSGRIVLSDITDSMGGEPASQSTRAKPYRMKTLDSFHPFRNEQPTSNPTAGCSAHYFEIEGAMLGAAWYGQGLRLLDISNARDVAQVGYYRVSGTGTDNPTSNSWDVAFRSVETKSRGKGGKRTEDYVYLFDMSRGVEVLKINNGGLAATSRMKEVKAPPMKASAAKYAAKPVSSLVDTGDSARFICPLFE